MFSLNECPSQKFTEPWILRFKFENAWNNNYTSFYTLYKYVYKKYNAGWRCLWMSKLKRSTCRSAIYCVMNTNDNLWWISSFARIYEWRKFLLIEFKIGRKISGAHDGYCCKTRRKIHILKWIGRFVEIFRNRSLFISPPTFTMIHIFQKCAKIEIHWKIPSGLYFYLIQKSERNSKRFIWYSN